MTSAALRAARLSMYLQSPRSPGCSARAGRPSTSTPPSSRPATAPNFRQALDHRGRTARWVTASIPTLPLAGASGVLGRVGGEHLAGLLRSAREAFADEV